LFTTDILDFLAGPAGCEVLDLCATLDRTRVADVARLRKHCTMEQASAAIELCDLRRRATAKFPLADRMFFDRVALEQATGQIEADYKARRLAKQLTNACVVDLGCGIGGDAMAIARVATVIAVEQSDVRAKMAELNLHADPSCQSFRVICGDALRHLAGADAFHIDPDRRVTGKRSASLNEMDPGIEAIHCLMERIPSGMIKLSPATDYSDMPFAGEIEVISHRRECRQMIVWTGALALAQLRATVLPSGESITDAEPCRYEVRDIGTYLYDPDPAVTRLRLLPQLASRLTLDFLCPGQTVLTSDAAVTSPLATAFRVIDVMGFHERKFARYLRDKGFGEVTVKPRGIKADVDRLAKQFSETKGPPVAVFLLRLEKKIVAVVCERGM
jgi:hypothetical protein